MQVGDLVRWQSKHYGWLIGIITGQCDIYEDSYYVKSADHPRKFYVDYRSLEKL
jgi:hypothetical protein